MRRLDRFDKRWTSVRLTHAERRDALGLPADAEIIAVSESYEAGADRVFFTIYSPHLPEVKHNAAMQSMSLAEARTLGKPRA